MSGPFSAPSSIPAPDTAPAPASINCGTFWPETDLVRLRKAIRIDQAVTDERLRDVAKNAILDVMDELESWKAEQLAAGYAKLTDVPSRYDIDGESDYAVRWGRAIASVIAADLSDRQLGQSARQAGVERAEELSTDAGIHRRNVTIAVRDFLGRSRIIAEAI